MRTLPFLLLALCVSTASAGVIPITSFGPDTSARATPARADTVERPVWIGIQYSPVVGDAAEPGQPRTGDAEAMPWLALSAAWPWTSPQEAWLAIGYEHWELKPRWETIPFAPVLLPLISPLTLDHATVRTGIDQVIARDHVVSAALGVGVGVGAGYGVAVVGTLDKQNYIPLEILAHARATVRAGARARIGFGISAGQTWLWAHGAVDNPFAHWELELRLEHAAR